MSSFTPMNKNNYSLGASTVVGVVVVASATSGGTYVYGYGMRATIVTWTVR